MKKTLIVLIFALCSSFMAQASERTAFTNMSFGWMPVKGDFIKVENYEYFDEDKTHFLIEVNGKDYKDIIKETKALYGNKYKCMLSQYFVETMSAIGVVVGETVDLKLYLFDWGHKVFDLKDVPVTEANLEELQFNSDLCSDFE
jgi:hypothetical protein